MRCCLSVGIALLLGSALGCAQADLVLRNGKIVTLDDRTGEVQALAVRGDRILAVGSNQAIQRHVGPRTKVIDLAGNLVIPGFIEGHGHFTSLGRSRMMLDLTRVENWDAVIRMVERAVVDAGPGAWILGRGWHQEKWDKTPD